jgi:hypothetical protein
MREYHKKEYYSHSRATMGSLHPASFSPKATDENIPSWLRGKS